MRILGGQPALHGAAALHRLLPRTLVSRMVWMYAVSLLVCIGAGVALYIHHQFSHFVEEQFDNAEMLRHLASANVADSVVIGDYDTVQRTLAHMLKGSNIAAATFTDHAGGVITATRAAGKPATAPPWMRAHLQQRLHDVRFNIAVGERNYGELRLAFDAGAVTAQLWHTVMGALALALAGLCTGVLVMRVLLRRWFGDFDRVRAHEAQILAGQTQVTDLLSQEAPQEVRESFDILGRAAGRIAAQRAEAASTLAAISDGVITLDDAGRVVYGNPAAERMLGIDAGASVGLPVLELLPSLQTQPSAAPCAQLLRLERAAGDGDMAVLEAVLSPLAAEVPGRMHRVLVLRDVTQQHELDTQLRDELLARRRALDALRQLLGAQDPADAARSATAAELDALIASVGSLIRERKDVEAALRSSRVFLDKAAQLSGVGGWELDLASGALKWTEQTWRIVGLEAGSRRPVLATAYRSFSGRARVALEDAIEDAITKGLGFDLEVPMAAAGQRRIWVRLVGAVEHEAGVPVRILGAIQDITARRALEEQARRNSELLGSVIEKLPCGLSVFDPQRQLVLANAQFRRLVGEPQAHADMQELVERVRTCPDALAFEHVRADGTTLDVRGTPMPGGGVITTYTDITRLAQATDAAQSASRAKSQFLANMSHELRTPMNAVLGMLALLQRTGLTPRQADYTSKTERAARSLLGLLNDILDFSKVEAGKMTLDPRPFTLDEVLRELSVVLSATVGAKPIELLFDIDPRVPQQMVGDPLRLLQVLVNLGGNAVKFTEQGEVALVVELVRLSAAEATLAFAVHDSGIGIAAEHQARIFNAFTQAENSTTRRYGGTGLGVAISQRLVALMGGDLQLDSALGRGSCFHFRLTLPLAPEAAAVAPPLTTAPLRALVVDDNERARRALVRMGQSLGWTMVEAADSATALAQLRSAAAAEPAFHVALVDWGLPGLHDDELARRLRALSRHGRLGQGMAVVAMAGSQPGAAGQGGAGDETADHAHGVLVKPITTSMLLEAVSEARPPGARADAMLADTGLAGMRVLLVEDNTINQQVAQELLEFEGVRVEVAHDGLQAVQALRERPDAFDAVLMDLQMPVMDGLTATRWIREELALTELPIIAMTANAMASDRQACLDAGMDEHIGKPYDLARLVRALRRCVGWSATVSGELAQGATGGRSAVLEAAAAAQVDIEAAWQRMAQRRDLHARSLRTLVDELGALPARLQAHAAASNAQAARLEVHSLKGLAATLGATALAAAAAQADQRLALRPGPGQPPAEHPAPGWARDVAALTVAIEAARPRLQRLLQVLEADGDEHGNTHVNGHGNPDGVAAGRAPAGTELDVDPAQLHAALQLLDEQLRHADMAATHTLERIRWLHGNRLPQQLRPLDSAMAVLDFSLARRVCQELLRAWRADAVAHPV